MLRLATPLEQRRDRLRRLTEGTQLTRGHHGLLMGAGGGGGGGATDPDFASVVLLMHMDGTNGGTSFPDVKSHTITPYNSAATDTGQFKFGSASALLDSTKYLLSTATADQRLTGTWCVEGWYRFTSVSGYRMLFSTWRDGSSYGFYMYANGSQILTNLSFVWSSSGAVSANTWHHIAVNSAASTGTKRLFIDGVLLASNFLTYDDSGYSTASSRLGYDGGGIVGSGLGGYMDDFRLTIGAQRYTSNFTPPAAAFPDS